MLGGGFGVTRGWAPASNPAGINEEEDGQGGFHRQAGIAFCGCSSAVVQCSIVDEEEGWGDAGWQCQAGKGAASMLLGSEGPHEGLAALSAAVSNEVQCSVW